MSFEETMRKRVIDKLSCAVQKTFPQIKVRPFGSYTTGLYLPTSDIDISLDGELPEDKYDAIRQLLIDEELTVAQQVILLKNIKVPLIKYTDKETNVCVDISFNNTSGLGAILYVKKQLNIFPNIAPLFYFIRLLLLQNGLGEVFYGGLGSFSLFLMLVSFFQTHPERSAKQPTAHLGLLLLDFLIYYGSNFEYYRLALRVDERNSGYELKNPPFSPDYSGVLVIYDPNDPTNNVAKGTYRIYEIRDLFRTAYSKLKISFYEFNRKNTREQKYLKDERYFIKNLIDANKLIHETRKKVFLAHQALTMSTRTPQQSTDTLKTGQTPQNLCEKDSPIDFVKQISACTGTTSSNN